jgi:sigma-B regulation protein RsbU (phosphoserine phosphatase)
MLRCQTLGSLGDVDMCFHAEELLGQARVLVGETSWRHQGYQALHAEQQNRTLVGQHEELLVIRRGGQVERLDTMALGFPVGLEPEISDWVHAATITLQPGDGVVLYTDGIPEAENVEQQHYGLDRLCAVISQQWSNSAEAIKEAVVDDVKWHIGQQKVYDDLTLVVLKQQ